MPDRQGERLLLALGTASVGRDPGHQGSSALHLGSDIRRPTIREVQAVDRDASGVVDKAGRPFTSLSAGVSVGIGGARIINVSVMRFFNPSPRAGRGSVAFGRRRSGGLARAAYSHSAPPWVADPSLLPQRASSDGFVSSPTGASGYSSTRRNRHWGSPDLGGRAHQALGVAGRRRGVCPQIRVGPSLRRPSPTAPARARQYRRREAQLMLPADGSGEKAVDRTRFARGSRALSCVP